MRMVSFWPICISLGPRFSMNHSKARLAINCGHVVSQDDRKRTWDWEARGKTHLDVRLE